MSGFGGEAGKAVRPEVLRLDDGGFGTGDWPILEIIRIAHRCRRPRTWIIAARLNRRSGLPWDCGRGRSANGYVDGGGYDSGHLQDSGVVGIVRREIRP